MLSVLKSPSPNFDERDPAIALQFIVIHYTDMVSGSDALKRLSDPVAKVSAHYLIEEDGRIFALVDETKRAWHAGVSFWKGITDINSASIGIELSNPGHRHGYKPFPAPQIEALKDLLYAVAARHQLTPGSSLLAHSDVAPTRKVDPGEFFPWKDLAEKGLGTWPKPLPGDYELASDAAIQELLRTAGYECPDTGTYDRPTRAALLAFQRRYHQENLTGTPEPETLARLRAIARLST